MEAGGTIMENFKERLTVTPTVKMVDKPDISLFINRKAILKMQAIVGNCDKEIGWIGWAEQIENGSYFLTDVMLPEQKTTGATCELDPESTAKIFHERMMWHKEQGLDNKAAAHAAKYNVWGHSHVNMGVFSSSQDDAQFKDLISGNCEAYFRIIANKKGEMCIDVAFPESRLQFNNIPWGVYDKEYSDISAAMKKEVKEKVKPLITTPRYQQYKYNAQGRLVQDNKKTTTTKTTVKKNNVTTINKGSEAREEPINNSFEAYALTDEGITGLNFAETVWVDAAGFVSSFQLNEMDDITDLLFASEDEKFEEYVDALFGMKHTQFELNAIRRLSGTYQLYAYETALGGV